MSKINKDLFGLTAVMVQDAIKEEGEALKKYQDMLNCTVRTSQDRYLFQCCAPDGSSIDTPTAAADRKMFTLIIKTIKDYMSEEMKHLKGLTSLYEVLTGIKPEEK